jgi:HNH endonuclease
MKSVEIGTVYEKISTHNPRKLALVSQRLNATEEYEDGVKIVRRALRNRESAFVSQLTARGIQHETFSAPELIERIGEICDSGAFDMCIVAGEISSQSVSIAVRLRNAGFSGPVYLEMTEEEANKKSSLDAVVANASRSGATDLLSRFVYLTRSKRSPNRVQFETADSPPEAPSDPHPEFTRALIESYKRARTEAGYNAPYFLEMLNERKGHATATHLIHSQHPSIGFTSLWERRRLDLTVEATVLRPEWQSIFADADLLAAYRRLEKYEFPFPVDFWRPKAPLVTASHLQVASLPNDIDAPPARIDVQITRIIRDTLTARNLKALYEYRCQICGFRIEPQRNQFYIEAHHVQPLGGGHNGLDITNNMLVLCPNHHALFDYGAVRFVSKDEIEIEGKLHAISMKHELAPASIAYHNKSLSAKG